MRFGSLPALIASLEQKPDHERLVRAREADDLAALKLLAQDAEIAARARRILDDVEMWSKTWTVEMRRPRHSGPSSPKRSIGAESTLDRRREAVEVYTTGFNFPGEGTDGEQSSVAVPPRSADAAEAQPMRDRR